MSGWLIDKSALVRLAASPDAEVWAGRIQRGLVRVTTVTRLEVGYSARSADDLRASARQPPLSAMPVEYLTPAIEDRAVAVQALLADRGQHRAPSVPDLLLAATGEFADLTVLHVDKDFELIAEITGQSVERLALVVAHESPRSVPELTVDGYLPEGLRVAGKAALVDLLRGWLSLSRAPTIGDGSFGRRPWLFVDVDGQAVVLNADTKRAAVETFVRDNGPNPERPWRVIANCDGSINKVLPGPGRDPLPGWYAYLAHPRDTEGLI